MLIEIINRYHFKYIIAILTILISINYINAARLRHLVEVGAETTAPNNEYKIKKYYLYTGDPMIVLFRVYSKKNILVAEHTREVWPGSGVENWHCDDQHCTKFQYAIGEVDPIFLPPTWFDNLRAKIP